MVVDVRIGDGGDPVGVGSYFIWMVETRVNWGDGGGPFDNCYYLFRK